MKIAVSIFVALLLGGCAGGSAPAQEEVAPQACVDALALADETLLLMSDIMDIQTEAIGVAATAMQAVSDSNFYLLNEQTNRVNGLTGQVSSLNARLEPQVQEYVTARDACRAATD